MADDAPDEGDSNAGPRESSVSDDAQWDETSAWEFGTHADDERQSTADTTVQRDAAPEQDRIPLDLSPDADDESSDADEDDDPHAPEPSSTPVVAGDPDLENAVFVVLGAVAMLLVIARLVSLPL
ncbi:DUF7312 domain-containing protein [Natronolimnobius baerhuensis]|uniref:DUF7312 domain-containing protein n=1 Tax=Natronolimnobius baerhuensis TaxID=253108 RepID=A0A202E8E4_9EURY|nr:hypothetical protein [Natronolimnobius baerhuensis]OVE84521.1 hypothetical protein B2G88_08945 [Natronolimnobius baerhuensis]